MPPAAPSGLHAAGLQFGGDGAQRGVALNPQLREDRSEVLCELISVCGDGGAQGGAAFAGAAQGCGAVGVAEPGAAGFGGGEGVFGAPRDGLAFGLGHERHDADGEVIGLRHVDGQEPRATGLQGEQEGSVAGQAVELGDDQRGAGEPGQVQGLVEFRPVDLPAALDFGEAGQNRGAGL